jgi:hypothetical protein
MVKQRSSGNVKRVLSAEGKIVICLLFGQTGELTWYYLEIVQETAQNQTIIWYQEILLAAIR